MTRRLAPPQARWRSATAPPSRRRAPSRPPGTSAWGLARSSLSIRRKHSTWMESSAAGNLTKIGGGTLQLDGANTYTGNTLINQGTVAGSAATIRGNVAFGGSASDPKSVTFDQFSDATYGGTITGAGSLLKIGKGTLTLTGANTYAGGTTVQTGTLQGNSTSLRGNIVNDAALVFNQASDGTYSGNVSGAGTFTKIGAARLLTTGSLQATGGSYVQG